MSERDFEEYPTPAVAVEAFLQKETLPAHVLEPCGPPDSPLVRTLETRGHVVTAFDLVRDGVDFLNVVTLRSPEIHCVFTNPPFSRADEIVRHAFDLGVPKIVVLERIQWCETRKRAKLFRECGLTRVWVFSDRVPRMHKAGWLGKQASPAMALCWFVFERDAIGHWPPSLDFLELPK
jgi:hypothetical protein